MLAKKAGEGEVCLQRILVHHLGGILSSKRGCRSSKQKAKSCRLLLANDLLLRDGESGESFRLLVAKIA